jgi:type II secretory pathway component GspD/PulD (secretin)
VGADRKTINLSLIPEVSEATADAFVYTGDVKLPKFTSRNLSTTVVANSGDTVVLGGMIKESRTKTVTKVPFLGDIPLLGAFFKKDADSIQRKNLLIFVTAKILSPSGEEIIVAQK